MSDKESDTCDSPHCSCNDTMRNITRVRTSELDRYVAQGWRETARKGGYVYLTHDNEHGQKLTVAVHEGLASGKKHWRFERPEGLRAEATI